MEPRGQSIIILLIPPNHPPGGHQFKRSPLVHYNISQKSIPTRFVVRQQSLIRTFQLTLLSSFFSKGHNYQYTNYKAANLSVCMLLTYHTGVAAAQEVEWLSTIRGTVVQFLDSWGQSAIKCIPLTICYISRTAQLNINQLCINSKNVTPLM